MGLKRYGRYLALRIVRLSHMPGPLARAIACGLTVSFFPVFGTHTILAFLFALIVGAPPVTAAATALVVPPMILPLLFSLDFLVGRAILRAFGISPQSSETAFVEQAAAGADYIARNTGEFTHQFEYFFLPALIGGSIFMLLAWPASYMAAHKLIDVLEQRHRLHRAQRAQAREHAGQAP